MEPDPGPCRPQDPARYFRRYHFNQTSSVCELFLYGGCGGNHNNFENKTDCQAFCGDSAPPEDKRTATFDAKNCVQSPKHGKCHLSEPRWFFSHWDNICKPYNYSGCGANMNSFLSEAECQSVCPSLHFDDDHRCEKLRNRGDCTTRVERQILMYISKIIFKINFRYFYDKFEQKCVKFGGCSDMDDSENNFETRQDCINTCKGNLSE